MCGRADTDQLFHPVCFRLLLLYARTPPPLSHGRLTMRCVATPSALWRRRDLGERRHLVAPRGGRAMVAAASGWTRTRVPGQRLEPLPCAREVVGPGQIGEQERRRVPHPMEFVIAVFRVELRLPDGRRRCERLFDRDARRSRSRRIRAGGSRPSLLRGVQP